MSLVERRVAADPERALGHEIRVREGAGDAVAHAAEGGLADEVPAEEKARRDSVRLEEAHEVVPAVPRVGPHRDREAEPARLGAVRRLREDELVLIARECLAEEGVVATAGGDEVVEAVELLDPDRRLQVGRLQVVAEVRVDVLVVVALRKVAVALLETDPAGVLAAGIAPAVAAPVADRLDDPLQARPVREHGAALAHRDLVGRVEREGREVAERADGLAADPGAERVAAVLDEEEVV